MTCHKKGFTLIELILAVAIIGIVAGFVGPMIYNGVKSYSLVASRKAFASEARHAMSRIEAEAILIPNTDGIDTWTPNVFQFDIPAESNINYSLSGGNLMRSGAILATNVSSLTFIYLDQNGAAAASKSAIRRIGVELVISSAQFGSLKVRSQIFPRRFSAAYDGFN